MSANRDTPRKGYRAVQTLEARTNIDWEESWKVHHYVEAVGSARYVCECYSRRMAVRIAKALNGEAGRGS